MPVNANVSTPPGPLRVHPSNGRWFADPTGRVVWLTGSHTWANLQERRFAETPEFDYERYLDDLQAWGHNFIRMWVWEHAGGMQFTDRPIVYYPMIYRRTGPGTALDGEPKFDLTQFNEAFFARLRDRVVAAGRRGMYVSVMLFQGFSLDKTGGDPDKTVAFRCHPMNRANNINDVDGDPDGGGSGLQAHTLDCPDVLALQEAYVRKVIDTVGDLPNVLWEISNESHEGSVAWQYHMIDLIHRIEAAGPMRHPVGMSGSPIGYAPLAASEADWIAPRPDGPVGRAAAEPADGAKVVVIDTDHINPWDAGDDPYWPWRAMMRGYHFIVMDGYMDARLGSPAEPAPQFNEIRRQMGLCRVVAGQVDLARLTPSMEAASSEYALICPGTEYLVFTRAEPRVIVRFDTGRRRYAVRWLDCRSGRWVDGEPIDASGGRVIISPPCDGYAVLHLSVC